MRDLQQKGNPTGVATRNIPYWQMSWMQQRWSRQRRLKFMNYIFQIVVVVVFA